MFGTYTPTALFGPTLSIGRKQYFVSFFYQALVAACAAQLQMMTEGKPTAEAFALGTLAFAAGIGAFAMMMLAIKARLSDCGMSPRWLSLPLGFLALDLLRSATGISATFTAGTTSLFSLAGLVFTTKTAVVALLLLLMFVPGLPSSRAPVGAAS
jgi:hypothetical protein